MDDFPKIPKHNFFLVIYLKIFILNMVQLQFLRHHVLGLWQFVHCFSPLLEFFLRQSFSLGNDPNGNVTLPVPNMAAAGWLARK